MLGTQEYTQVQDAEDRRQREDTHKICVVNVRSLVSCIYMTLNIGPDLPVQPYRKIIWNELVMQRRERETTAQAAKHKTLEVEARRKKSSKAQAAMYQADQPRQQRQGERRSRQLNTKLRQLRNKHTKVCT